MRTRTVSAAFALSLGTLVSHGFGLTLVPAMLPRIEDDLQSGYGVLGLAVATGLIAYAAGSFLATPIMRVFPSRALLVSTFLLTGAGLLVCSMATSPELVALAVVLMGLSAPISWTATMHIARQTVKPEALATVASAASGGAAFGVVINGVLVRTSGELHDWEVSFWFAAVVALAAVIATLVVFPDPVGKPDASGGRSFSNYKKVLLDPSGRLIVATSGVSGVAVFTVATFLTATAIDEMGTSDTMAASLLWIAGGVGVVAAIGLGGLGDKRTPALAIFIGMSTYATTLVVLTLVWGYPALVLTVVGYGVLNGPVWGLMGAMASRRFTTELGVAAISLGLVAASLVGAVGNSVAGAWLETTGSMRWPIGALALMTSSLAIYLFREVRRMERVTVEAR